MPEEKQTTQQAQPEETSSEEYIKTIAELSKRPTQEQVDKLRQENKQLIQTLASGGTLTQEQEADAKKTSDDYAKELVQSHSNLDYVKLSLKQREKALEEGKPDPYMPHGANFQEGRADDAENAQRAADFFQRLVDDSGDNPAVFNSLLQARLKDDPTIMMHLAAKKSGRKTH